MEGRVVVSYRDGTTDICRGGDLFYWPPGHNVRVEQGAEVILFSPQEAHLAVIHHMSLKLVGAI